MKVAITRVELNPHLVILVSNVDVDAVNGLKKQSSRSVRHVGCWVWPGLAPKLKSIYSKMQKERLPNILFHLSWANIKPSLNDIKLFWSGEIWKVKFPLKFIVSQNCPKTCPISKRLFLKHGLTMASIQIHYWALFTADYNKRFMIIGHLGIMFTGHVFASRVNSAMGGSPG